MKHPAFVTRCRACSCRRSSADMRSATDEPSPSEVPEQNRDDPDGGPSTAPHQSRRSNCAVSAAAVAAPPEAAPVAVQAAAVAADVRLLPSDTAGGTLPAETSTSRSSVASQRGNDAVDGVATVGIATDGRYDAARVAITGSAAPAAAAAKPGSTAGTPPLYHFAVAGARVGSEAPPQCMALHSPGAELQPGVADGTRAAAAVASDGCEAQMPPDVSADSLADQPQPPVVRRPSDCASEPGTSSVSNLAVSSAPPSLTHSPLLLRDRTVGFASP